MIPIFQFDDYRSYLTEYSRALPKSGYGFKSKIAKAAGCKTAYIAQVFGGCANFSAEQAESISAVLNLNEVESDFFLLLVQRARAGTEKLQRRIHRQMEAIRLQQLNMKQRFKAISELPEKDLYDFFGRWYINAIQIATTIPRLKTRKALQKALGLGDEAMDEALHFLLRKGLLAESDGKLIPGPTRIFIGNESPILKIHHINWRNKAIQSLDDARPTDIHFTSVYSLSTKDAVAIRESLIREIEKVRSVVKPSKEEELHTLGIDFFRVDRE